MILFLPQPLLGFPSGVVGICSGFPECPALFGCCLFSSCVGVYTDSGEVVCVSASSAVTELSSVWVALWIFLQILVNSFLIFSLSSSPHFRLNSFSIVCVIASQLSLLFRLMSPSPTGLLWMASVVILRVPCLMIISFHVVDLSGCSDSLWSSSPFSVLSLGCCREFEW